jgi:sorting nexin-25
MLHFRRSITKDLTNLSDRKIRENVKGLLSEMRLLSYINLLRDSLWPGGKLKPPDVPRTAEEKIRTRDEANRKLSSLVPGMYLYCCYL